MICSQPSHLSQRPSVLTFRSSPSGVLSAPECCRENHAMCLITNLPDSGHAIFALIALPRSLKGDSMRLRLTVSILFLTGITMGQKPLRSGVHPEDMDPT